MKIKRFEAASMSEALRKIKKEFGEDAVILSAKSVKRGSRLLGGKRTPKVVVTAAIDALPADHSTDSANHAIATGAEDQSEQGRVKAQGYSRFSILEKFKPITRTGQTKVKPKIVKMINQSADESVPPETGRVQRYLRDQGVSTRIAAGLENKVSNLTGAAGAPNEDLASALAQVLEAMGVVHQSRSSRGESPRVVVMVGPSGVGKTSAVAKLAAKHTIQLQEKVGLISLDNQRMAGTVELERYASILGADLVAVGEAEEAASALASMGSHDLVVVDTPGLCLDDQIQREHLRRKLETMESADVYLLLSAAAHEKVAERMIEFFKPMQPVGLMFTQLDWVVKSGTMINQAVRSGMSISFLSDSAKVPEGIHAASAMDLAALLLPDEMSTESTSLGQNPTVVHHVKRSQRKGFVANRNSDIFHRENCKSVKRINTQNMILFKEPAEAMGQRFKPCRMCCGELLANKPLHGPATGYAGYRC